MGTERAFILGVILGVAGSLIPDIPSAITMHRDDPSLRIWVIGVYVAFALAILLAMSEMSD